MFLQDACIGDLKLWINRSQTWFGCTPHVSLNSSVVRFGTINFDNIKRPYYSLLAEEVAKFHFRTNKQFMNSGSCCVVDLEQWTSFKGAVSGCLSYCRDTNLRGVKWSTEASIGAGIGSRYSDWLRTGRPKVMRSSSDTVKNFLFSMLARLILGPIQPPIQFVLGTISAGVKRPGREADHSPPTSAKVKNTWIYTSTTYAFMA
jgi:hypothetical protein